MDSIKFNDTLDKYTEATKKRENKKKEYEESCVEQSDVVEELSKIIAPAKKLRYQGKEYSIVVRGDNWFLRGSKGEVVG